MNTLRIHHTMTVMAIVVVTASLLLFQYYDVSFASAYMTDPVITITYSPPLHHTPVTVTTSEIQQSAASFLNREYGRIDVLNPQSYPVVGGEWTINFRTYGTHNLTISVINGTTFGDSSPDDVGFVGVLCGNDSILDATAHDGIITFEDYQCDGIASLVLSVHTPGIHDIHLSFGADTAYASNNAYPNSVVEINSSTANGPTLSDFDRFGFSVTPIGDLDGDGVTDLAVGAAQDDGGGSDRGAVHIMFMNTNGTVNSTVEINDSTTNGPTLSDDDFFGRSVAAIGDLDGDGVTDLAVGADRDDNSGSNRGAVHIMFMNADGTVNSTVEINDSTANGPTLSDNDRFGVSVTPIGDLDGDGVTDLAVGANRDDGGGLDRGAVHIMFMNTDGTVDSTVEINSSTANGPTLSNSDYFGFSVAAIGDLDGDGVTDLAVGAHLDNGGGSNRGAVHIMFMNTDGTVDSTVEINDSTANGPTLSDDDYFGVSVTPIGDLDGDGVTDLAVGAYQDDGDGGSDRGAVHIMFMNMDGTVNSTVEINDSTTNGPTLSNIDYFGFSVASIGDLDGDGVTDLAVGAFLDDNGGSGRGAVHIIFINDMRTAGNGSVDSTVEINSSTTNGPTLSNIDRFGVSVTPIGDLDGDGVTDLAVGASRDNGDGRDYGAVHIMFMNADGTVDSTVEINNSTANGPTLSNDDYFGISVASIGDLDGDGVTDLAVGAYGDDDGGSSRGAVHIMFMNTDGTVDSTVEINSSTANGPTLSNSDYFGFSVAAIGDLDGDGVTDLAVGAYQDDEGGRDRGAVHIMFMNTDGTVDSTVEINDSTTNGPTLLSFDSFGISVAAIGDLDGDGVTDLAVGAYRDDDGRGSDRGAVHIMFMNADGTINSTVEINDSTTNGPTLSSNDRFGVSVTPIGDLDGDGVTDLAVGAHLDNGGGSYRGAVHIMFMNMDGTVDSTVEINDSTANGPTLSNDDYFGVSVASIGDLDGDGVTDLAVGASRDNNGGPDRGAINVIYLDKEVLVRAVSSTTADGTYGSGDTVDITIKFSEPVTVTGTPQLALDTNPSRQGNYSSGSGTDTLTFKYEVQTGDTSADLQYVSENPLMLVEGVSTVTALKSPSEDAVPTLPDPVVMFDFNPPGAFGSLGQNKDIVIGTTATNQPPTISSITGDTTINEGASGTLTGTASDSDGTISSYLWSVDDTSTITITTGDAAILQYTASQVSSNTQVTFTLTVTDDDGATASATYDVTVNNVPVPNQSPTISSITGDTTINEGASGTLTGTASDSDGTISTYAWSVDDTSVITITSGNAATLQYTASQVSSDTQVTFTLTVTDDDGATASATYDVTVNNVPVPNQSPTISSITGDTTINEGASGTLTGTASDSDGTISTYAWSVDDTSVITITSGNAATLQYTASQVSSDTQVTFTLTVTDDDGATASATYDVTVNNVPVPNQSPTISSITGDTTINEGTSGTLTGIASDSDGTISTYAWSVDDTSVITITSGNAATLQYTASQVSSDTQVTFTLTVTDDDGATAFDTYDVTVTDVSVPTVTDTTPPRVTFIVDRTVEINDSTTNGPTLSNSDRFGVSVTSIGDLDGDGVTDLAVGAHRDDDGGLDRGAVHIMFMNTDGTVDSTVEINDSTANGPTLSSNDRFGVSVTPIGDLDGDGVTDLAVGAYQDNGDGGSDRGAVHIMFMNADGTVDSTVEINNSTANGPRLSDDDNFGRSVASIGDLDGDGVTDLAVGAYQDDGDGGSNRGAVHIMFMNTDGTINSTVEINDSTANGPTLSDDDDFGFSVTPIGDLDGDGVTDLAVGASRDDDGGPDRGAVHIMFMNTDGTVDSTVEINDSTANGPTLSNNDNFGRSVASIGDFDGDGVTDLAVGAYQDDNGGSDRGAVHIMFMNTDGTVDSTVEINDSTANGPTLSDSDKFGASVASIGDLDGDGVTDLAVGAYRDDNGGRDRGAINVIYLDKEVEQNKDIDPTAPTVTDTTPPRVASILRGTPLAQSTTDTTLVFAVTFDEPVTNVDAADFTVTGTGTGTISGVSGSGTSYRVTVTVTTSGTIGLDIAQNHDIQDTATNRLANLTPTGSDQTYTVTETTVTGTTVTDTTPPRVAFIVDRTVEINDSTANGPTLSDFDRFGVSVTPIGDLDGDGVTDLAVGASRDDDGGLDRGAVHIMFMNADGTVDSTVEINNSTANGPTLSSNDYFGASVASIGDLDGDGVTDLAVGAHRDDDGGSDRGAVHIMFMNADGTVDSTVEINNSTANGPTLSDNDRFGVSVASIGDLDGDGVTDLAVGAYQDDNSGEDRGAVHIMFMNADGTVDSTVEINDSTANGPTLSDDDFFGASVASIGDLDGDGVTDLAVGAHRDDDGGSDRGAVHIMFMNADGTVDSTVEINNSTANGPTLSDEDNFGRSVASIGDFDGDGVTDLAVGAQGDDGGGGSDRGAVHIMFMNTDGTVDSTVEINDSTTNGPTLSDDDYFGASVASIGDLDGDGVTDLAVGAYGDDDGGSSRGAINVIYLDKEVEQNKDIDPTAPTVTDTTPPRVASILRGTPLAQSTTDTTLVFAVTFDEPVTNVDAADFTVTGTGTGTISGVSGSGASYRVTVAVDNVGTIGLDIAQNHDIQDTATNRLANLTPTGSDQTYTVTVTDTTPPRVASILRGTPLAQSTTDTTLVFAVTFDEPVTNVDDADFTVTGSGTGTISGVSGSGTSYRVTVTVTTSGTIGLDIAQNHDIQDTATNGLIDLTVIGSNETYIVNQLPVLNNISPQTGDELTLLTFTAEATDPDDNDARTYSLIEPIPDGATMDTNTGVFSWTPTEEQDGRHTITVQVSDGNGGTDSQNVTITVTEVNQNPRLDPIGAQTIDETDTLRFTATAHDVDIYQGSPNSLRFSLDGDMPRGASITREGSFSWRPDQSQDGVHSINVTVSDGNGGTASELVSVTVNDIAPRLVSVRGSGSSITLTFSEPVKINGAGLNGFTVSSSSGSTVTVESITGNGTNTLTLLLDGSLSRGDTLSYDSGTGDVVDESGKPLESFVDAAILLKSKKSGTAPPPSVDTLEINGQSYNVQNRVNHHATPLEVAVDQQPISMSFTAHDRLDILYFAVYLNLQDDDISYTNSDTYVEYNRGQTNIVDPHNLFSDASITISTDPDDRNKKTVALDITFADAIGNTNMVIRTWNADRQSSIVIIVDALNIIPSKVDPEPQATTEADPEPQVAEANPEPRSPAAVPDNPEPVIETFDDDSDYDRALLVLRMWSGFESEVADDGQLLDVMGLTHMGTDIPAWVMTDLAPLVVKGLITLDEFRVALQYVMGNT